ncbi:Solute carrier family 45 member 3 [Bagarius yarrelli]|uniref:Solute carrier family 45 member 3 n=1 Tax=Bagarius yarrelli TaxID=175774 RepID=A0A556V990_BAGYA|nr:Solute carrier family 45 member 3 [Bagarius yarrelli]
MQNRLLNLILVNVLTCGLEICMATSIIYIPPMLLKAGVQERFMTMVLGVGPVLGLILVPPLGSASDSCCSRYGRRRPFIWALCVGMLLGLLVFPRASLIASLISEQHQHELKVLLLVLSICVMEFSGQACYTPLEALVSDLYPGEAESRQAFSVYSIMLSLGGCIGYLLPALDWTGLRASLYLGGQEAFIYFLLTGLFLMCILSTALINEVPTLRAETNTAGSRRLYKVCCWPFGLFSRAQTLKYAMVSLVKVMPRLWSLCSQIPRVIMRLFVSKFCSWMALMTFLLFYTDFVAEELYDGVPSADPGSPERLRYDEGVRVASLGLFLQCVTSVTFSILMERLVECLGARVLYLSSLTLLALSTAIMTISKSIILVTAMAALTGYTFCVLQILPYTLTCLYHSDQQVFFSSGKRPDDTSHKQTSTVYQKTNGCLNSHGVAPPVTKLSVSLSHNGNVSLDVDAASDNLQPQRGICLDMAILDSAFLLSQVLPSLLMGSVVQLFSSVNAYMMCASVLSLIAVLFSSRVIFTREEMQMLQ